MSERKPSQAGSQRIGSILISIFIILIFLMLPWVFIRTSTHVPDTQVSEEVGLIKNASDLLSPQIWWYLLPTSVFFLSLAFYFARPGSSPKPIEGANISSVSTTKGLALRGFLSLEIYFFFFLLPFPLHRYYDLSRVSMGWIADRSWVAAITLSFVLVALFLLYVSSYRLALHQDSRLSWGLVLLGTLSFGLINLFVFPISSTDLYDYVSRGRISGMHGGNPLVQTPNDYPEDPYVQLAAWKSDPSVYGPLWEVLSGFIGRYAGGPLWNDMLGYKAVALISYLLSTVMIAAILQRIVPHRSLAGTILFAWNPLVILEGVANAHNDMIMIAFMLGGFWILGQVQRGDIGGNFRQPSLRNLIFGMLAVIFLALAILVKYIPILLLPLFLMFLLAQQKGWQRRFTNTLIYLLPMALVFFLYYRVFWKWPESLNTLIHRTEMFRMSLASLTKQILGEVLQAEWAQGIAAWSYLGLFIVGYLLILVRTIVAMGMISPGNGLPRNPSNGKGKKFLKWILPAHLGTGDRNAWDILVSASLNALLLYLLLGSLWFWPWYLIWPMALLALSKNERLVTILIVVGCAGQLSIILWNFVWHWMGIEWETLYIVENLVLSIMILPAVAIHLLYRRRGQLELASMQKSAPTNNPP